MVKRILDLILSMLALVVSFSLMLALAVMVRTKMGSPILFKQERKGVNKQSFTLLKFRTMTYEKDGEGKLLKDSLRLTCFGRFLRNTSLDELPQLFNVLKGDMSLVGPRPLIENYGPEKAQRFLVKPGITGISQVSGRNALSFEDRFKLDAWYVENQSLWLDVKIMLKTLWVVIKMEGVECPNKPEFGIIRNENRGK